MRGPQPLLGPEDSREGWSGAGPRGAPGAIELSMENSRILRKQTSEVCAGGPGKIGSCLKLLGLIFLKQGLWSSVGQSESGISQLAPHLFLYKICHFFNGTKNLFTTGTHTY